MSTDTTKVWRVRPKEGGSCLIADKLGDLADLLDAETTEGHGFEIERVAMTAEELAKVGEFDGW